MFLYVNVMETGVKCTLPKCNICFGIGKLMKNLDVLRHTNQPIPKFGLVFSSGRNKEIGWTTIVILLGFQPST